MSIEKKAKLIYSGELILFAVIFLVFAILRITRVIPYNDGRRLFFNILTLCGGIWTVIDLVWALMSKRRQKRIAMIDKLITFPAGIYLIIFNIYCLINAVDSEAFKSIFCLGVGILFIYLSMIFTFQAIYHYYKPVPLLLEAIKEEEEETNKQIEEANNDNNEQEK